MAREQDGFRGFGPEAAEFLAGIEANNNREWFEANKPVYEERVKGGMIRLLEAVAARMVDFAPEYIPEPKKAVFRIYRDVRFSKDKRPYKTNVAASFNRLGVGKQGAGFYVHLDRKEFVIAAGIYMPEAEVLKKLRLHVARTHEELREILAAPRLKKLLGGLQGEPLTRTPKGFLPGDPAEDLLRHKMYIVWTELDPALAYTPKVTAEVVKRLEAATPLVEYLNRPLREAARKAQFLL
ncbi:MAG: DUF2461 domain-containing protein [Bryobacter sp.]|jgi:uncharacterized protein (TIGR02453 family)|nr:DUF2461 domain-containing protein [Bryobacter sp. CoA8 C33]